MPIFVKEGEIIVPGQVVAEGDYKVSGSVYRIGRRFYAKAVALVHVKDKELSIIPLKEKYIPSKGDVVIGKVVDITVVSWVVDINSPYTGILQANELLPRNVNPARQDLSKYLAVGDIIVAKVLNFNYARDPLLTVKEAGLGRVKEGTLIEVDPAKVPRIIGRKGSMINLVKEKLGVDMIVGKNGRVIVRAKDPERERYAALVVRMIEEQAHVPGLTDRVNKLIDELLKGG